MSTRLRKDDGSYIDADDITGMVAAGGVAALTENSGAIGGTNDGDIPTLTATVGAALATTAATTTTPYGFSQAQADGLIARVNALIVDNVALRAAARENAAKINALITALEA